jgi:hypothetical protein
MVAKITIPKSIEATLNYNEKKVQNGTAECLYAGNYLKNVEKMNFYQKLNGFEILNRLNKIATTKTLHVSLNFDPSEKLSNEKLTEIAAVYMERIGFGEQPYLFYKHLDAGHPHVHIVSTTIRADGTRINTHNIGRNQSEKARKEIEQIYKLVKAENQKQILKQQIKQVDAAKVIYGKSETKRSISNVLNAVVNTYKYTSLPELNAALKQFNVIADRGSEAGRIYKNRGLVYRILDANGNKIGVPVKASSISGKPTLDNLEKKFEVSKEAREPYKQRIKNVIGEVFTTPTSNFRQLIEELEKKQVYIVIRQNAEGRIYGITFVDNQNKCVFNGSDLGKGYSAAALQSRIGIAGIGVTKKDVAQTDETSGASSSRFQKDLHVQDHKEQTANKSLQNENLLEQLLLPKQQNENIPFQFKKKRKRKKRNFGL